MDKIRTAKQFNADQTAKYHLDCQNWKPANGGFPQIRFYLFDKNYGYIWSDKFGHYWYRTKKEIINVIANRDLFNTCPAS
jgi:hypothetical protein